MQKYTPDDKRPACKRHTQRKEFYKDYIDYSPDQIMFLDGNKGIDCLFLQAFKNMLLIFECKKKDDKSKEKHHI